MTSRCIFSLEYRIVHFLIFQAFKSHEESASHIMGDFYNTPKTLRIPSLYGKFNQVHDIGCGLNWFKYCQKCTARQAMYNLEGALLYKKGFAGSLVGPFCSIIMKKRHNVENIVTNILQRFRHRIFQIFAPRI